MKIKKIVSGFAESPNDNIHIHLCLRVINIIVALFTNYYFDRLAVLLVHSLS